MKKILVIMVSVAILGMLFAGCSEIANITAPGNDVLEKVAPVDPADLDLVMYASSVYDVGPFVSTNMSPYAGWTHAQRLCPQNALGEFDAMPGAASFNERFFGVASRTFTEYRFEDRFMNVDNAPDIEFCEVTWGTANSWHVEAVLVYLTGATVRDEYGVVSDYGAADNGIGYYAGIAWNRTGIAYVDEATRIETAEGYLPGVERNYDANEFSYSGTFGWTQFNLPDEVVCADGVYLVDITADVYGLGGVTSNFTGPAGGALVTGVNCPIDAFTDVMFAAGIGGNTDGYDLDAIRVYKCVCPGDDTATGFGEMILDKGTWFMYNYYPCEYPTCGDRYKCCYDIQAGNPKNGTTFIGEFCVEALGEHMYEVTYEMDPTIEMDGYIWDIVVVDEHLGISNDMDFTAVPGQDDNQDFGVPFYDEDGEFYIFAHFAVEYQ